MNKNIYIKLSTKQDMLLMFNIFKGYRNRLLGYEYTAYNEQTYLLYLIVIDMESKTFFFQQYDGMRFGESINIQSMLSIARMYKIKKVIKDFFV